MRISLTKITQFSGHKEAIYALVYYKGNKTVLSAGADGYIVEWDVYGNGDGNVIAQVDSTIYSLCLDSEKNMLYATTRSGELYCIDLLNKKVIRRVVVSSSPLFSSCIHEQFLFLGDESGNVYQCNLEGKLIQSAQFGQKTIRQIISSPNSLYLATSSNHLYEIDKNLNKVDQMLNAHESSIFTCALSKKKLWSGGRDAVLKIWQANELVSEIKAHNLHINSMDYNPEHSLLITGSMDKSVKIWDSKTNKLIKVINKEKCDFHISSVNKVLWIGSNEFISCGDDHKVIYTEIDIQ